jgi:hypothetical protein
MEANKIKNDNQVCRAMIEPDSGEGFDFAAVAVPSVNGQVRFSYENNEYFIQVLGTDKENIDVSRMESGLPLFDNHPWDNSAVNTLGITTEFEFVEQGIRVKAKLGARADEALRKDIKDGIIKTVSIEGSIQNYEIIREPGKIPVYRATLWTPESLSFAPVPNDIGAQIEVKRALNEQIKSTIKPPESDSFLSSLIKKF